MQATREDRAHAEAVERTFSCRTENSKSITQVLLRLCNHNARKDQECRVEVTPTNIIFLVTGKAKTTEGRASFVTAMFDEFFCNCDVINFTVNISTLLDCLLLFGASSETTAAIFSYSDKDAIFCLSLEDSGVLTTCDIYALMEEDDIDADQFEDGDITSSTVTTPGFNSSVTHRLGAVVGRNTHLNRSTTLRRGLHSYFRESAETCQLILKSDAVRETIQELSDASSEGFVNVVVTPVVGHSVGSLSFKVAGVVDSCEIQFPSNSAIFVQFQTLDRVIEWKYRLSSFQLSLKAVDIAVESFIRINEEGILCIQHQIENSGHDTFIDFLILADVM